MFPGVAPPALKKEMDAHVDLCIVDLRSEAEFAQGRIEGGAGVAVVNLPYMLFLEDEEDCLTRLPAGSELVVACGKGGASAYVARRLADRGRRARNLVGGMAAWGAYLDTHPAKVPERDGLWLLQFHRVARGCLSYLIGCDGEAVVVDPGRNIAPYVQAAAERGLTIRAVIDTHLHADHISGGPVLSQTAGARYFLPATDGQEAICRFTPLDQDAPLRLGARRLTLAPILTPGHTRGSTSLLVDGRFMLTGDTLSVRGVGRPDLGGRPGELVHRLYETLFHRLWQLNDTVEVYPAHACGPPDFAPDGICSATLGEIRRRNNALRIGDRTAVCDEILSSLPPPPANCDAIRLINMGRRSVTPDEAAELETGPTHCATGGQASRWAVRHRSSQPPARPT